MATVSKETAEEVIALDGWYPGDHIRVVKVVEYDNAWGGKGYGLVYEGDPLDKYQETFHVRNPVTIWEAK